MRHFLVVGPQGEFMGLLNEIAQKIEGSSSAFNAQDFYSNKRGVDFIDSYDYSKTLEQNLRNFFGVKESCPNEIN